MSLDSKLEAWTAAGIIDAAAAARIRSYEDEHDRPYALWAVIGLGLLALALGIMLVVAANWDRIPDALKLGGHWVITAGAAGAVWYGFALERKWLAESALFLLAALVLAGIALHAQVFQLVGPIWQALLLWLLLAGPALLIAGRTRVTGYALALMSLWLLVDFGTEGEQRPLAAQGLAMAGPSLLILVSLLRRPGGQFADALREVGIVALLAAASLAHFAWADDVSGKDAADMLVRLPLPLLAAGAAIAAGYRWQRIPRAMLLPLLAGTAIAVTLAVAVPHPDGWIPRFIGALVYAAMWGWIAAAAAKCGWRALFGIAIAAIAIRIFIVYFELFGTLATTGIGLIAGGALLIALAFGWRRMFKLAGKGA